MTTTPCFIHRHPSVRAFTVTTTTDDIPSHQIDAYPEAGEFVVRVRRPLSTQELEDLRTMAACALETAVADRAENDNPE